MAQVMLRTDTQVGLILDRREALLLAAFRGHVTGDEDSAVGEIHAVLDQLLDAAGLRDRSVPWDAAQAEAGAWLNGSVHVRREAD